MRQTLKHWILCRIQKDQETSSAIKRLHPREEGEKILFNTWKKRIQQIAVLLALTIILLIYCASRTENNPVLKENQYLVRQSEDTAVELLVSGDDGTQTWQKKMSMKVKQRQFTREEKEELQKKVDDYIGSHYLGKNESPKCIVNSLNFVQEIPDTQATITWSYEETYLREDGSLRMDKIPQEGIDVDLVARVTWRNWKQSYHYPVHLDPSAMSRRQKEIFQVKQAVKEALNKNRTEDTVELPGKVGETKLSYQSAEKKKDFLPAVLSLFLVAAMPLIWREQQKKALKKRDDQMMSDHPEILNKVMLLLGAGLTFRGAIDRIVGEYEREKREGEEMRYAYEEMCILAQEMRDGQSEISAIENFGKRCCLSPYLKFSSILSQNLKKGAEGMIDILNEESYEALEKQKERALRLGEIAGTKLLLPMVMMLAIVMGIIMIPAFMTM